MYQNYNMDSSTGMGNRLQTRNRSKAMSVDRMLGKSGSIFQTKNQLSEAQLAQVLHWSNDTPEHWADRKRKKALAAAQRRANETPEQTAERRRKNRERQRKNRAEMLRKTLAGQTGCELEEATKPEESIGESSGTDNASGQSYVCIACKTRFDNPMKYFEHIQQACLNVYLKQPEVLSKILTFVQSKMKEIRRIKRSSEVDNGTVKQNCSMCGDSFLVFTASTLRLSASFCGACCKVQRLLKSSAQIQRETNEESLQPRNSIELQPSYSSNGENESMERSDCGRCASTSVEDIEKARSAVTDLLDGAVPLKRPLLTCETELPTYIWPKQSNFPIKAVKMHHSKSEPYTMHYCWECDKPILPTSKRFLEHFKMLYECQWCIYTTHCHPASVDHVMRVHANEEATQGSHETPPDLPVIDIKAEPDTVYIDSWRSASLDVRQFEPHVKAEAPDMDPLSLFDFNTVCSSSEQMSTTVSVQREDEEDGEYVPLPPAKLRCLEITSTTLLLQWDPPSEDKVTSFNILFQGSGAPSQHALPPERTLVRLAGLTPDTLYVVRVYTVSRDAVSQYAILFRKTSTVDESEYHSEVLQSPGTSSSFALDGISRSTLSRSSGSVVTTAACGNSVDSTPRLQQTLISNIKVETLEDEDNQFERQDCASADEKFISEYEF